MTKSKLWWFLSLVLVLTGCGAGAAPPSAAKSARGGDGASSFEAAPSQPGFPAEEGFSPNGAASAATPAAAPPGDASKKSADSAPPPESRPGLGTEWGESRTSRTHDVTFVRDSSRPFAIATMNYNDRKGALAQSHLHDTSSARRDISTGGGAVTISIKDSSGNALEAIRAGDRTIVIGEAGQRYSIVLTNHSGHRFESVVTVDGLDVINGKPGTAENRGYVLLPFATLEIEGFRQSVSSVASFRFASVSESYAAQTGTARNVGVIGAAFFSERGDSFDSSQEAELRDTASPFPADPRFAHPPRR
jgi:hypothetical protein